MLKEYNVRVWHAFIIAGDGLLAFDAVQIRRVKTYESARRPGRGVDHTPPSSVEVKAKVQLYLFFPPSRL